jgi:hypothetical protein
MPPPGGFPASFSAALLPSRPGALESVDETIAHTQVGRRPLEVERARESVARCDSIAFAARLAWAGSTLLARRTSIRPLALTPTRSVVLCRTRARRACTVWTAGPPVGFFLRARRGDPAGCRHTFRHVPGTEFTRIVVSRRRTAFGIATTVAVLSGSAPRSREPLAGSI